MTLFQYRSPHSFGLNAIFICTNRCLKDDVHREFHGFHVGSSTCGKDYSSLSSILLLIESRLAAKVDLCNSIAAL